MIAGNGLIYTAPKANTLLIVDLNRWNIGLDGSKKGSSEDKVNDSAPDCHFVLLVSVVWYYSCSRVGCDDPHQALGKRDGIPCAE